MNSVQSRSMGLVSVSGQDGQGMGVFPALRGQSADYIIDRLTTYKNRGQVGSMSSTMGTGRMLSESDINTIGKFIEETMND